MNFESTIKLQLQRNLEDSKPGKKQFPTRNLHYVSSIGPEHKALPKMDSLPQLRTKSFNNLDFNQHSQDRVALEIEYLQRQLEFKNKEIRRLSKDIQQRATVNNKHHPRRSDLSNRKQLFYSPTIDAPREPIERPKLVPKVSQIENEDYQKEMGSNSRGPSFVSPQVYLTKKAPKSLGVDPITGLPRRESPFRTAGLRMSTSKQTVRPFF